MNSERPLDQVSSIKTKLAVLVAASVVITAILALIGDRAGVPVWVTVPVTLGFALAVTYWLARGMTAPLREMTEAASAMAGGDYTLTVSSTGTDEVGALARAFTTMARDLAATDQQRRELISTVSHELRTPLAAQRAVLENLVDGVTPPARRPSLSRSPRPSGSAISSRTSSTCPGWRAARPRSTSPTSTSPSSSGRRPVRRP